MKVLISGYFGYCNAGDEALLAAMAEQLREAHPGVVLRVLMPQAAFEPGPVQDFCRAWRLEPVHRAKPWAFLRALWDSDLFVSGGGSLLQDATSRRSLLYYAGQLLAARAFGVPRMVYAQGVGPLRRAGSRALVRLAAAGAAITVRDEASARELEACGVPGEAVQVAADPVFAWAESDDYASARVSAQRDAHQREACQSDACQSDACAKDAGQKNAFLGVVWRPWPGLEGRLQHLWPALHAWARDRGLTPRFFPLHRGVDDACLHGAGIPEEWIHPWEPDPRRWIDAFSSCRIVLTMRYHGMAFAALAGVPALGIAYDPKVRALAAQLGLPEPLNPDALEAGTLQAHLDDLDRIRSQWLAGLPARLAALEKGARSSAELAGALLAGARVVGEVFLADGDVSADGDFSSSNSLPVPRRATILGVEVDRICAAEAAQIVLEWALDPRGSGEGRQGTNLRLVVTANPEIVMRAAADPKVKEVLAAADLVVADGIGLVWASRYLGQPVPERVAGIDLLEAVMAAGAPRGLRVFLCGGRPGVAEEAGRRLQQRFPGLVVCGTSHGYFAPDEEAALADRIAASGAHLLLAGLGAPRQELWLWRWRAGLGVAVAVGVGGALDVWAGQVRRAPLWMQQLGLEWTYRLLRQPSRAGRMLALPRFAWRVLWSPERAGPRRGWRRTGPRSRWRSLL